MPYSMSRVGCVLVALLASVHLSMVLGYDNSRYDNVSLSIYLFAHVQTLVYHHRLLCKSYCVILER